MRNLFAVGLSLLVLEAVGAAKAADIPVKAPITKAMPVWSWTGFYVGGHLGAGVGSTTVSNPYGPSAFGDAVTTPAALLGLQAGYNWQISPQAVVGLEADTSFLDARGTNTCLQISPLVVNQVGSNCNSSPRWTGTLTGRSGLITGVQGRTLVYGKGGLAWMHGDVTMDPNNQFYNSAAEALAVPTSLSTTRWGWTIGAGVEHAMTPAWSLKAEYDYSRFGNSNMTTPASSFIAGSLFPVPPATSSVAQDVHVLKLGVNYHMGQSEGFGALPVIPRKAAPVVVSGWAVDTGARYWYSSGKFQWDNFASPNVAQSRLTYDNLTASSGEIFARIDAPVNLFVKGFIGGGRINSGKMNDEDWGMDAPANASVNTAYTNTLSNPVNGPISYGTIDVGYDFLKGADYKAGAFLGYNRVHEVMNAWGCTQLALPASGICAPSFPSTVLTITETTTWQSLRVGLSGDSVFWNRVKIGGDVAYLPYVRFDGLDNHWLRDVPTWFTQWGTGRGVQAELIASYLVTDNFTVGVGGRYWAMWTTNGEFNCTGCNKAAMTVTSEASPFKGNAERYGMFVQASYKFGAGH